MNNRVRAIIRRQLPSALITLVFLALFCSFFWSLAHYWKAVLQPRLLQAALTHAEMLANSQATAIADPLGFRDYQAGRRAEEQAVQEMLLITDPAITGPFIRGLSIQVDYDVVHAPHGSLDINAGNTHCAKCFPVQVAIMGRNDQLLGIAQFQISDAYYRQLSADLKSKLLAESSLALILLVVVWITMLVLYGRLHRANQLIMTSDRAKTRFMANVSHELRTPLNAILGYTQLYKRDAGLMEKYSRGIETIDRSAEHLLQMINDILDFSKMDSERIELQPREVPLTEFLNALVEMTRIRARLKDIGFDYEFPPDLPAVVEVDDKRLRQVLLNLLSNAIKFTQQGRVCFRVHQLTGNGTRVRLRFDVTDTGVGIPRDKLHEIFLPFHQLDKGVAAGEGSGLGLTISTSLVARMGGRLQVDSSPHKGSRFWFDLDLPVVLNSPHAMAEHRRIIGYSGRRRHILFIDDNTYNRDVIRQQLTQLGFTVSEAENGEQGLQMLQQEAIDLVLLDLLMPGLSGFDVVERIRGSDHARTLPVLALTADTQQQTADKARACGFTDILTKPVPEPQLLAALSEHLQLTWEYETAPAATSLDAEADMPLTLPAPEIIADLIRCANQHDVLALRKILTQLEQDPRHQRFIRTIMPLVSAYQFRKLIDDLKALSEQDSN